ncbi:MAG: ion channel [Gemmataceae bacterium]
MLIPLLVGIGTLLVSVAIQSAATSYMLDCLIYFKRRGILGVGFFRDAVTLGLMLTIVVVGNLTQMAIWALVFVMCGQFDHYETALYFSAVNFTTLGYGDIVLTSRWRILGPLEAANGVLMFGLSAAIAYAAMIHIFELRLGKDEKYHGLKTQE